MNRNHNSWTSKPFCKIFSGFSSHLAAGRESEEVSHAEIDVPECARVISQHSVWLVFLECQCCKALKAAQPGSVRPAKSKASEREQRTRSKQGLMRSLARSLPRRLTWTSTISKRLSPAVFGKGHRWTSIAPSARRTPEQGRGSLESDFTQTDDAVSKDKN